MPDDKFVPGRREFKNSKYRGPFLMFLAKAKPLSEDVTSKWYPEAAEYCREWRMFVKRTPGGKEKPVHKKNVKKHPSPPSKVDLLISDTVLNYYLYRQLPESSKEELMDLYHERYDVEMVDGFSRKYLVQNKCKMIKKAAFILWINWYIRNHMSLEVLELDSFELVLKLGNIWNGLPIDEKKQWEALVYDQRISWKRKKMN